MTHIASFTGQAYLLKSESRSHVEYLIQRIIVLDSYFNLTNKFNLFDRLQYDLIQFCDRLVVAYFFGPPCIYCNRQRRATVRHANYVKAMQLQV